MPTARFCSRCRLRGHVGGLEVAGPCLVSWSDRGRIVEHLGVEHLAFPFWTPVDIAGPSASKAAMRSRVAAGAALLLTTMARAAGVLPVATTDTRRPRQPPLHRRRHPESLVAPRRRPARSLHGRSG